MCREALPVCWEVLPVCREAFPVHGEVLPVYGEAFPVHREVLPACGEAFPVCEEVLPVYEEVLPVRGEALPFCGVAEGPAAFARPARGRFPTFPDLGTSPVCRVPTATLTPDAKSLLSCTIRDLRDRLLRAAAESAYRLAVPREKAARTRTGGRVAVRGGIG